MMAARGLAKFVEELGECAQIAGKKLAYFYTDTHPDAAGPMSTRIEDEIADVIAAAMIVVLNFGLDRERILRRIDAKYALFRKWDADPGNNALGVDALYADNSKVVPMRRA